MARVGTVWLDVALDAAKAGQDMEQFGKKFSRNVSTPIAGVGALAVKEFAKFEASMAKVSGLSGVAKEQVEAWSGSVKDIGVQYGIGAQGAADALYFVTSSGISSSAALDVVAQSAKASAAGLGEAQTVADLTTSALNAYSSTGLTAAKATDVLTAAVSAGKGEPAEFAASLGQVLPIASSLGVSYEQVAGAEAAMTLRGLDASEATTALRGILSTLLKPTQQAEEALHGVGLSSEGLRKQLKDQGLLATLETLTSSLGNDAAASAAVFENVRALNGVMNILGSNTDETRRVMDQVANSTGATDKAFESAAQTTEFKMNQALAGMKRALIDVGGQIAPIATAVGGFASGAVSQFARLPGPIQSTTLTVAGLAAAIGPAAYVVGKITSAFATAATGAREFTIILQATNAAAAGTATVIPLATTPFGKLASVLGKIPFAAAAATASLAALVGAYLILQSKINDAKEDGGKLRAIGDAAVSNAKSFKDLQDFIGKANQQTAELQERFGNVKFDPSEREQIGALGEALAGSAEQAAKFSGQAIKISQEMGVSKDAAAKWILEQSSLGHTFDNADLALAAYRQSLAVTSAATDAAASATGKLALAATPLAEPFFALQTAARGYETALRGIVTAQRAKESADRAVETAERAHETALRKVTDAQASYQQSLRSVASAQRGVADAQKALNEALRETDQQLTVDSAQLGLERAKQQLANLGKAQPGEKATPVDPLDRREAELSVRRAQNDLDRAKVEIVDKVVDAQVNLRSAQDKLADSQRSADDAARAVADAQRAVGDSLRGIADAKQAAEDATIAVRDAQWQAFDAARALSTAQESFNTALSKGPALAGPFVGYLEQLRDRFPEVAGSMQLSIDKLHELQALAAATPYAGLESNSQKAPIDQPVGGDSARAYGGPVTAGQRYTVNERGVPELFSDGRNQYLLPTVNGDVSPLQVAQFDPAQHGGQSGPALVVEHLDIHAPDPLSGARRAVTEFSKLATKATAR